MGSDPKHQQHPSWDDFRRALQDRRVPQRDQEAWACHAARQVGRNEHQQCQQQGGAHPDHHDGNRVPRVQGDRDQVAGRRARHRAFHDELCPRRCASFVQTPERRQPGAQDQEREEPPADRPEHQHGRWPAPTYCHQKYDDRAGLRDGELREVHHQAWRQLHR